MRSSGVTTEGMFLSEKGNYAASSWGNVLVFFNLYKKLE